MILKAVILFDCVMVKKIRTELWSMVTVDKTRRVK